MTVKELIDAARKDIKVDGRTKEGRRQKAAVTNALILLNETQWEMPEFGGYRIVSKSDDGELTIERIV